MQKSNHLRYLYVINYNFVTTEWIFKIQNSAESYCLAESENYWYGHGHTLPYLLCTPVLMEYNYRMQNNNVIWV